MTDREFVMNIKHLAVSSRWPRWSSNENFLPGVPFVLLLSVPRVNTLSNPEIEFGFWIMEAVCLILTALFCSRLKADLAVQIAILGLLTGLSWAFSTGLLVLRLLPDG